MNTNNLKFGNLDEVQCQNCQCILDEHKPLISRIFAEYLGFCLGCIEDCENKFKDNSLMKERVNFATLILQNFNDIREVSKQQTNTLYQIFLMHKAIQKYQRPSSGIELNPIDIAVEIYGKDFIESIRSDGRKQIDAIKNPLDTILKECQDLEILDLNEDSETFASLLEKSFSRQDYCKENGESSGKAIIYLMDAQMQMRLGTTMCRIESFDKKQIAKDMQEVSFKMEPLMRIFANQCLKIIKDTNEKDEKQRKYYTIRGYLEFLLGSIEGSMNAG